MYLFFFSAFDCVHNKKKFDIPLEISGDCVKFAEQIIKTSYAHHENFCTVSDNNNLFLVFTGRIQW